MEISGHFDGDGSSYSYFDPRWPRSFLLYTTFLSASRTHIAWLHHILDQHFGVAGRIGLGSRVYTLRYAKQTSIKLLPQLYYRENLPCLERKRLKIERALATIGVDLLLKTGGSRHAQVEELEDSLP